MTRMMRVIAIALLLLGVGTSAASAAPPLPSTSPPVVAAPPVPPPVYATTHVVQAGENLTRIALRYGTTVWAIAQVNGIQNVNYIRVGQILVIRSAVPVTPVPSPCPRVYVVQAGDTLSMIAWRFGTSIWAIAQANGLWNPNYIRLGQTLYIPC